MVYLRSPSKILPRYGRLTTVVEVGKRHGLRVVDVICDCGERRTVYLMHLKSGHTKSCGCLSVETFVAARKKYSVSTSPDSSFCGTYKSWKGMIYRCTDPEHPAFSRYGGRGIRVCEKWLNSFEDFLSDMGKCPPGLTIERNNNDGNYEPGNCRWASRQEQTMNQTYCQGEENHFSKLTEEDVRIILAMGRSMPGNKIADLFDVTPSAVSCILLRKTWKHLTV